MHSLSRREFVASTAALPTLLRPQESKPNDDPVAFVLIGDTHFLADKDDNAKLDPRLAAVTGRLVDLLNKLPGTDIPMAAGGGNVLAPRGVIHAGDKANVKMQKTEWAAFADAYGLTGEDGKLKAPVYEVHGNHDSGRSL